MRFSLKNGSATTRATGKSFSHYGIGWGFCWQDDTLKLELPMHATHDAGRKLPSSPHIETDVVNNSKRVEVCLGRTDDFEMKVMGDGWTLKFVYSAPIGDDASLTVTVA